MEKLSPVHEEGDDDDEEYQEEDHRTKKAFKANAPLPGVCIYGNRGAKEFELISLSLLLILSVLTFLVLGGIYATDPDRSRLETPVFQGFLVSSGVLSAGVLVYIPCAYPINIQFDDRKGNRLTLSWRTFWKCSLIQCIFGVLVLMSISVGVTYHTLSNYL